MRVMVIVKATRESEAGEMRTYVLRKPRRDTTHLPQLDRG